MRGKRTLARHPKEADLIDGFVGFGSGPDLNPIPENGLLFRVERTLSLSMSAVHLKAVVSLRGAERRYLAMCGRLPVGKGFLCGNATLVGAAMCPAC